MEGERQGAVLYSGRIRGATALAVDGVESMVTHRKERWSSDASMVYVKNTIENALLVSTSLVWGASSWKMGYIDPVSE